MFAGRVVLAGAAALSALTLAGCSATATGPAGRAASAVAGTQSLSPSRAPAAAKQGGAVATPSITLSTAGPAPTGPCATTKAQQVVIVQVRAQHLWICDRHRTVRDSPVTTGAVDLPYDATPLGTFHVQSRDRHRTLTLLSGAQYTVEYWIPFDAPLFGFHDSSWQHLPYGSPRYRTKGSHGCVHVPLAAIRFLYGWARVGTTVSIRR